MNVAGQPDPLHPQPSIPFTHLVATTNLAEIVSFPATAADLPEVLAALTYALDLASGEHPGYTLRTCILGMNIGQRLRLQPNEASDLFYALLLNGLGTPSERQTTRQWMGMDESLCRHALRGFDWRRMERVRMRFLAKHAFRDRSPARRMVSILNLFSQRQVAPGLRRRRSTVGIRLARTLCMSNGTITAMRGMDERWDGSGAPAGLVFEATPLLSQICCVAQDLAAFGLLIGRKEAVALIERHSGRWYDPGVAAATLTTHETGALWNGTDQDDLMAEVLARDPHSSHLRCEDDALEAICFAVADVIDSRSDYTALHSRGVAKAAVAIGTEMQLSERELKTLRCAALLHDIGKLSVPADVLETEGPLTPSQMSSVRQSPVESYNILRRIRSFDSIALLARSHHERLDGSGYPDGLQEPQISRLTRILAMAEAYDSLSSPRPYRDDYTEGEVLVLLEADIPQALDAATFEALKRSLKK